MTTSLKTQKNDASVKKFLSSLSDERRKKDSLSLLALMEKATGATPSMWGDSIIGFGEFSYKYPSGREDTWFIVGFSPRKKSMTIYMMLGFEHHQEHLKSLGKHKTSKGGCLYINSLDDIDQSVLEKMIIFDWKKKRKNNL